MYISPLINKLLDHRFPNQFEFYPPVFTYNFSRQLTLLILCFLTIGGFFFSSPLVQAKTNELQKIGFSSLPGNRIQVNLTFAKPAQTPLNFTTDNPARLVLDFPNVGIDTLQKNLAIGTGMIQSANAVQTEERTRVVLNLVQMVPFNIEVTENKVYITFEGSSSEGTSPQRSNPMEIAKTQATPRSQESISPAHSSTSSPITISKTDAQSLPTSLPTSTSVIEPVPTVPSVGNHIQNIDFRKTIDKTGQVVITLSNPDIIVNLYEQGTDILLDFINTQLPPHLDQRLDVIDFDTPISYIDTYTRANDVQMKVTANGRYEYFASQTGAVYTLEVKEKIEIKSEDVKIEERTYEGQLVSFNFQNIEIRAALALLFDLPGVNLNMVASDDVKGNITLRLKKIPWDQALDIILESRSLGMRKIGNVVMIDLKEKIDARTQRELEAQQKIKELEPLRTEFIQINYAKAADLNALLKTSGEHSFLSKRGNVSMDSRTNTLIIQDTATQLAEIRNLINSLDMPARQVLIESRVVLASDDFSKKLGVKFGYSTNEDLGEGNGIVLGGKISGNTTFSGNTAFGQDTNSAPYPSNAATIAGSENFIVSLPISGPNAALGLAIGKIGSYLLQLELAAAETEGNSRTISSPRVITGNQRKATILQGSEIPYRTIEEGTAKTDFRDAVLRLEVTPQITPDDRIIMDLKVNSDKVGQVTPDGNLTIDKREVETQVLVDNGETVVLGGVYEQENLNSVVRIPFFSELPLVGNLFKSRTRENKKKELLIFVTPKIVKETT